MSLPHSQPEHSSRLRTMTLAFDEYAGTAMDEAPLAEEAARMLGSEHTTIQSAAASSRRCWMIFLSQWISLRSTGSTPI